MEKVKSQRQLIEHQRNVTSAAYTYHNLGWMSLKMLAESFHVSENTITDWLCEAISKRYIECDSMCKRIRGKHIAEYESTHKLSHSSLREKYDIAFAARSTAPIVRFGVLTGEVIA